LEAVDVNWPEDFELANLIASGIRERSRRLLSNIKHHMTSSLLSDLLDDLGYQNQVIRILTPNLPDVKILGRAKTLKLRELESGEDFRGIYNALESYNFIIPGDVIVVQNAVPAYAYFGELNAHLAVRCGAEGVVIGGGTRDSFEVRRLGLPVFSSGYTCQDVRKRATTESMNKPIEIEKVFISPNELIFGDSEGVVVIPKEVEALIISEVFQRVALEEKILVDLSRGAELETLVKKYGFF
jgi:regulator of RNase E activity RraA